MRSAPDDGVRFVEQGRDGVMRPTGERLAVGQGQTRRFKRLSNDERRATPPADGRG